MKKVFVLMAMCLTFTVISCRKDDMGGKTDPLPFPMDDYKDLSVSPGDDFFSYCNGTWYKNTPTPATGTVGGVYDAQRAMVQRVEEMKKDVPEVRRFFEGMDHMWDTPEASMAYVQKLVDAIPVPQNHEEAFRYAGKLLMEGVPTIVEMLLVWQDGKNVCSVFPATDKPIKPSDTETLEDLVPVTQTKSGEDGVISQIVKGMGLDMENIYVAPSVVSTFESFSTWSLEDLYQSLVMGVKRHLYPYVSSEALEESNSWKPTPLTEESAKLNARMKFAYPISYHLVQKYFPASIKEKYLVMTKEVVEAFRERLVALDWMSETTKSNAIKKIDAMQLFVGYPDEWCMDGIPKIEDCETFVEIYHRLSAAKNKLQGCLKGSRDSFTQHIMLYVLTDDEGMVPTDLTLVNAMYDPASNSIMIYPAMMMSPVAREGITEAHTYAEFVLIGHEITHGFDQNGALYDEIGSKKNWWTVADKLAFERKQNNLINCYGHMEYDPERQPAVFSDGTRTLGENIADLGGFLTVLDVYKKKLVQEGYTGDNYNAQLRKFYESYADFWRVKYGDEKLSDLMKSDVHSVARLRVNGVVMNTDLWYELYGVNRNNVLYLPEDERTYIW
ncbi:MAG: M13 family metallopeptidase [Bacteroidales bacterium]|jgi:predicted metalloendopeptidase|nr:M13 family metallopeptidase [Bacteroidales bacterium]